MIFKKWIATAEEHRLAKTAMDVSASSGCEDIKVCNSFIEKGVDPAERRNRGMTAVMNQAKS
jgi:hypothetical protein